MAFNLQSFRSALKFDGARPNQFQVSMTFPAIVGAGNSIQERFAFMCKAAEIPPVNQGIVPVDYFGAQIKVPGDKIFDEWTVTVYNDEDFAIRRVLERWSGLLRSHGSNFRDPSALSSDQYSSDAEVIQFGKTGPDSVLQKYKFIGMWPSRVDPISLDWGANDQIEEYSVTFAYQWWEDDKGNVGGVEF